jgi:hypothetical protein
MPLLAIPGVNLPNPQVLEARLQQPEPHEDLKALDRIRQGQQRRDRERPNLQPPGLGERIDITA